MRINMKIKVVKCRDNEFWYFGGIGKEYNVRLSYELDYIVTEGTDEGMYIEKDDCIIIDWDFDKLENKDKFRCWKSCAANKKSSIIGRCRRGASFKYKKCFTTFSKGER
jgi:hypothetical protein